MSVVHSIEKIYHRAFDTKDDIIGDISAESVKTIVEFVTHTEQYIKENKRRNNRLNSGLSKYLEFLGISSEVLKNTTENSDIKSSNNDYECNLKSLELQTVDFSCPEECAFCKPYSFTLNGHKHLVKTWVEIYKKFLMLLYIEESCRDILHSISIYTV